MANELLDRIWAFTDKHGGHHGLYESGLPWFGVMRSGLKTPAMHRLYKPSLCLVVQGEKQMFIGADRLTYGAMQAAVVKVDMPAAGRVADASKRQPFLGLMIDLDIAMIRELLNELDSNAQRQPNRGSGAFIIDIEGALADTILRLVRLLDDHTSLRILGPSLLRELSYWLLTSKHADAFRSIAVADGRERGVAAAIRVLLEDLAKPVRIASLAKAAHMSSTAFHEHFKSLTSLTPLQYQKRLRLLEARRLMMDDAANAETAAFTVGYQSASQFSREYTRMFGASPKRNTRPAPR